MRARVSVVMYVKRDCASVYARIAVADNNGWMTRRKIEEGRCKGVKKEKKKFDISYLGHCCLLWLRFCHSMHAKQCRSVCMQKQASIRKCPCIEVELNCREAKPQNREPAQRSSQISLKCHRKGPTFDLLFTSGQLL